MATAHGPVGTMGATTAARSDAPAAAAGWPRWAAATVATAGVVVLIAETTSYLAIVGILLVGLGTYELVRAGRRRRSAAAPAAP
ncbi:MAG TPA: hypothetical protein VMG99_00110 [Thermoplasmata archaeon]|nr:hypothetical protein [Thermoplasmata archaeon]